MPLRDQQRRGLIDLLNKELRPVRTPDPYNFYILMARIAQLPEEKIKPLLTDEQRSVWHKQLDEYKNMLVVWRQAGMAIGEDLTEPAIGEKP